MITVVFVFLAMLVVAVSYYLKFRFSGINYTTGSALAVVVFNLFCGFFHMELTQKECMLFYKCFPRLEDDYPVIAWISLICIFLHCFAIPTAWEPWRLFRIRRKVL